MKQKNIRRCHWCHLDWATSIHQNERHYECPRCKKARKKKGGSNDHAGVNVSKTNEKEEKGA